MTPAVQILQADLLDPAHQRDILAMTAAYALDEMANGEPLPANVLEALIPGLQAQPSALIMLAYVDGEAVGIATCFGGFSTFAAKPLFNIHDLAVLPGFRGLGIGRLLLEAVAKKARALGCCKLTLEVLENNARARRVYHAAGFSQAVYSDTAGGALFYSRAL